jgi:hypothetical protein
MKTLTLKCVECHKIARFTGKNVDEIIAKIDKAKWRDRPKPDGDLCPDCDEKLIDQPYDYENDLD